MCVSEWRNAEKLLITKHFQVRSRNDITCMEFALRPSSCAYEKEENDEMGFHCVATIEKEGVPCFDTPSIDCFTIGYLIIVMRFVVSPLTVEMRTM